MGVAQRAGPLLKARAVAAPACGAVATQPPLRLPRRCCTPAVRRLWGHPPVRGLAEGGWRVRAGRAKPPLAFVGGGEGKGPSGGLPRRQARTASVSFLGAPRRLRRGYLVGVTGVPGKTREGELSITFPAPTRAAVRAERRPSLG